MEGRKVGRKGNRKKGGNFVPPLFSTKTLHVHSFSEKAFYLYFNNLRQQTFPTKQSILTKVQPQSKRLSPYDISQCKKKMKHLTQFLNSPLPPITKIACPTSNVWMYLTTMYTEAPTRACKGF